MPENQRAKKPKIDSLKRFNKVRLLQILGLLSRKFNYDTLEFEKSWLLQIVFYLSLISKPLCIFKPLISYFFASTDFSQLVIGSVFNYVTGQPRVFLGIGVSTSSFINNFIDNFTI